MTIKTTLRRSALVAMLCVLLLALLATPVAAETPQAGIEKIDIDIKLNPNGSASFTEIWDVTVTDGTEFYVPVYGLDGREITDFTVTDENGTQFTDVGNWDSDLSFDEKAGKSGLLKTNGGYELCWGLGSYGHHTYTLSYTMTEFVRGYTDADGIYRILVPKDLFQPVQDLYITMRADEVHFTKDNSKVWAFGFSVNFGFEDDGTIQFQSTEPLKTSSYASALVQFDKGLFSPSFQYDKPFEEDKEIAMEGSGYTTDESGSPGNILLVVIMGFVAFFIIMGFFLSAGSSTKYRKKRLDKKYKEVPYSRHLPFEDSLAATYARLHKLGQLEKESDIIGVYILRWINSGLMRIEPPTSRRKRKKNQMELRLVIPDTALEDPLENQLYDMFIEAAGDDEVLQSTEFEKWSKKNHTMITSWLELCKNTGVSEIKTLDGLEEVHRKRFFGLLSSTEYNLTPTGEKLTTEMFGFKRYLSDFTIINEREAREVVLWDKYLVYAQLFGIAETVAEQFKALYPDYFKQMATQAGTSIDLFDVYLITRLASSYSYAATSGVYAATNASSGGGGFYSGGGGFSGAGGSVGGGTR